MLLSVDCVFVNRYQYQNTGFGSLTRATEHNQLWVDPLISIEACDRQFVCRPMCYCVHSWMFREEIYRAYVITYANKGAIIIDAIISR